MNFTNSILNTEYTQNGALTNKSSLSAVLDLFSMGVSSKNKLILIDKAFNEDPILTTKVVFYLRDIRGGQGNRDIFRSYITYLLSKDKIESFKLLIPYIPVIGRWKDLYEILEVTDKLDEEIIQAIVLGLGDNRTVGLVAKWLPRKGKLATKIRKLLSKGLDYPLTCKEYRKTIVRLSNTVEQLMSANRWDDIDFSKVPSIANKNYSNAFRNRCYKKYQEYLQDVQNGKAKMNASALYPHEIVHMANNYNYSAEAMWKSLPNYMEGNKLNILPIIDTSGSMTAGAYSIYSCLDIAVGLGIYFAEHNTGSYKDVWCNFSSTPNFCKLKGDTLKERIDNLDYRNWEQNTNLQAVADLVIKHSTKEDSPDIILIVSDMEFDSCTGQYTNFELIKKKYKDAGIKIPTVVFWRVDVKGVQQPVVFDESGTILLNGYSPYIMKALISGNLENINPYLFMLEALGDKYDYVDSLLCI